ncbi:hypothetical protein [Acidipropionibacterium jensenii]|nr:hypothetical protein [Acidipropionibacterium jensenii]
MAEAFLAVWAGVETLGARRLAGTMAAGFVVDRNAAFTQPE